MSAARFRDIINGLLDRDQISLTDGQKEAMNEFYRYHHALSPYSLFILRGAAGTGKTFLIRLLSAYLMRMGYQVVLLAPTGKAAKVITRRTRRFASTIHRYIYTPVEGIGGSTFFRLKDNKDKVNVYYIVDEASMVGDGEEGEGKGLLTDLLSFIFSENPNRRLIMVGDPAQLPPVGSSLSPALDPVYLKKQFKIGVGIAEMTEVMRQADTSDILLFANEIRKSMSLNEMPVLDIRYGGDIELIEQSYETLELYTGIFESENTDKVIFLTYSNNLAVQVNKAIRNLLFDTPAELIPGEILMVVRNNYAWGDEKFPFIANGEMGIVRYVHSETYEERYGLKWIDVDIEFQNLAEQPVEITCKVVLDLLEDKRAQLGHADMQRVIIERRREFDELSATQTKEKIRKDPYVNALQVKYGYAITGHKSQGGQWQHVLIGFEPIYKGMNVEDYLRWTYTCFTRAEERLYLLNFPFLEKEF